jgi:hypothetical protein
MGYVFAGELTVMQEARFSGDFGLMVEVDSQEDFLEDSSPVGLTRYRARFYCLADDLTIQPGGNLVLFRAYDLDGNGQMEVALVNEGGTVKVKMGLRSTTGWQYLPSGEMIIPTAGYHCVELDYQTGVGNGYLRLTFDGDSQRAIEGIQNSGYTVEYVRLGVVENSGLLASGNLWFDEFMSTTGESIGTIQCGTIWQYQWGFSQFGNGADVRDLIPVYNNPCFVLPK